MNEWNQNMRPFGHQSLFKPLDHPTSLIKWQCSPCIGAVMGKLVLDKCFEDENHDMSNEQGFFLGLETASFVFSHCTMSHLG